MSLKVQFLTCTLSVILYLTVCLALLKLRRQFYASNETFFIKSNRSGHKCCVPLSSPGPTSPLSSNSAELEVKLLEYDELNGESIDLQEIAAILQRVSNACKKSNLKTPLIRRHFLYSAKHQSLYCWIRKVASTSFTKLFSEMNGRRVARNYYRESGELVPSSVKELQFLVEQNDIFKLLVVRHPFERLVSSYRDRIEDNTKYSAQAWIHIRNIFNLTRPQLLRSNTTTGNFLQKTFNSDRKLKTIPTFKEFVEWLLKKPPDLDDVHWSRYATHCAVCNVTYNFILKLDDYTFGQINYIFTKLGLDKSKAYLPNLQQSRGGYTGYYETCKYLRTLPRETIVQLHQRYRIDFEMYNYDLDKYMRCTYKA